MNSIKNIFLLTLTIHLFSNFTNSQTDSLKSNENKLLLNPHFSGFHIEGTFILIVYEFGGLFDYDIYSSKNNYHNLGLRFSTEYYEILDLNFGGGHSNEGPYLSSNIYVRHTIAGSSIWFSSLAGISYLHSFDNQKLNKVLLRIGLELKYSFVENRFGALFKFAYSPTERIGYLGVGLFLGFYIN